MASIVFLLALAAIVTSAVRNSSSNKWVESLRNAAEIGADYSVNQFNSVYPCPLDPDPASGTATRTTLLPSSELQATPVNGNNPTPGVPNITVSIKVTTLMHASDWTSLASLSSAYSPQLDPNQSVSKGWQAPPSSNLIQGSPGGFRIIESTATNGVFSRTVRTILRARFDSPPNGTGPTGASAPTSQSFFNQPMFANTSLTFNPSAGLTVTDNNGNGTTQINGTNTYNLNLSTNQIATIGPNTTIIGNVVVSSNGSASGQNVATLPGGTIDGRLTTNGEFDTSTGSGAKFTTTTAQDTDPNSNVLANADTAALLNPAAPRSGDNLTPAAVNSPALAQNLMAPTPSSTGADFLGSLAALSANGQNIGGQAYQTVGLDSTGVTTPITVSNNSVPTKLFVQDGANSSSAVNLNSSALNIQSSDPRNLQIFYEGNRPVNITVANTGTFKGLIYAPNAAVNIKGGGDPSSTFAGAVVGKSVNVTMAGTMKINTDLANVSGSAAGNPNVKAGLKYQLNSGGSFIQGWQPITWQEFGTSPQ